ncbi:MAG TPA: SulP family inorganic anion transporter [Anaerolineales bacterium]|nr:SulP family inorganic anion transporter [Anaerolineales bacterium]
MSEAIELAKPQPWTPFLAWIQDEFNIRVLPRSIGAALLLFVIEAILAISLAALVFKGPISDLLPYGIALALVGQAILLVTINFLGTYSGAVATIQDAPVVILALAVPVVIAALPDSAGNAEVFSTTIAFILGTSLLTGAAFLLVGLFKLGGLVRFLPYPVLGGFLAGTGWLLVQGGVGVMFGSGAGSALFAGENLLYWLPGLISGVLLFTAMRKWQSPFILVAGFALVILAFYAVTAAAGLSIDTLLAQGWLLGPFPTRAAWELPLAAIDLSDVHWPAITAALPAVLPAVLIGMVALLLNAGSLELVVRKDLDLNRELVASGVGNILVGIGGGLIGYSAISLSALNHEITRGKRLPPIAVALLLVSALVLGTHLLSFLPRIALGALLVYIGAGLLYEWVVEVWSKFTRIDALIVMAILVTIALSDFLWGIGIGMVLTIVLFLVNYSRINVVRYVLTGQTFRSRFNRGLEDARLLEMHGQKVSIFKLEGFIFFGTANNLYEQVHAYLNEVSAENVDYLILDFDLVSGLDATGLLSFEKMRQDTRSRRIHMILAGMNDQVKAQFESAGFMTGDERLKVFPDLDHSMEWCEDQLILTNSSIRARERSLVQRLRDTIPDVDDVNALLSVMTRRDYPRGAYLMRAGDAPDEIMLIEHGLVSIQLEEDGKEPVRLETTGGGRIVGELGFYLKKPRTAHVVADEDTTVYVLHRDDLDRIGAEHPHALQALTSIVVSQTSERIVTMTRVLDVLEK